LDGITVGWVAGRLLERPVERVPKKRLFAGKCTLPRVVPVTEKQTGYVQEVDILTAPYLGSEFLLKMLGTKLPMGAYLYSA
jgi:hypothetical protein